MIRRKRWKMVGTGNASAQDEQSPVIAKVLLLRDDSRELSEVLLPSPLNVISHMQILGDKNYRDS